VKKPLALDPIAALMSFIQPKDASGAIAPRSLRTPETELRIDSSIEPRIDLRPMLLLCRRPLGLQFLR